MLFIVDFVPDPSIPVAPIVIMPENSGSEKPSSQYNSPVMPPQIELSVSTNARNLTQTPTTEDEQIFSMDMDLYGSPGVAFSVKKTRAMYGMQSPPRKNSNTSSKKTTTNRTPTTSVSETSEPSVIKR